MLIHPVVQQRPFHDEGQVHGPDPERERVLGAQPGGFEPIVIGAEIRHELVPAAGGGAGGAARVQRAAAAAGSVRRAAGSAEAVRGGEGVASGDGDLADQELQGERGVMESEEGRINTTQLTAAARNLL